MTEATGRSLGQMGEHLFHLTHQGPGRLIHGSQYEKTTTMDHLAAIVEVRIS